MNPTHPRMDREQEMSEQVMEKARKHARFRDLSVQELEAEERLEEELAEREDVRRFDEGFRAYEQRLQDEELDRVDQHQDDQEEQR